MFRRFSEDAPEPASELAYRNPFTLLVAVVLSAQATDVGVNKATKAAVRRRRYAEKMVALGEERVREHIKTIGLFRNKAKNVIALSRKMILGGFRRRSARATRDDLVKLPGVGRKTANVVLNDAFGEPPWPWTPISSASPTAPARARQDAADEVERAGKGSPPEYARHAHHWLILHGRYVCKARIAPLRRLLLSAICAFIPKKPPERARRQILRRCTVCTV